MDPPTTWQLWTTAALVLLDLAVRVGLTVRVVMRRLPVGTSLAWIVVVLTVPLFGAGAYLLLGENRLGRRRREGLAAIRERWRTWLTTVSPWRNSPTDDDVPGDGRVARLARTAFDAPLLTGNRLELLAETDAVFASLVADIDAAQTRCDLEFYIWHPAGRVLEVQDALLRAVRRGVRCRVLVDALGSKTFLRGGAAETLRQAGIDVRSALPTGLKSLPFVRPDLRLHRKIAVIDGRIGYTGSLNLADPAFFKQEAGVGRWVDAMARIEGPAVHLLSGVFLSTWSVEGSPTESFAEWAAEAETPVPAGSARVQVLPSGPAAKVGAVEQLVLSAIYEARREIVITTPYFVPSESLLTALFSAAASGVRTTLVVPEHVDSRMVRFASRAFQEDLVEAGVRVALFEDGLLHTKSITVDDELSLFGSVNLDPRSFRLNFEITLAVYDAEFASKLRALQEGYVARSRILDLETCRARTPARRFAQNAARLAGPLL